MKHFFEIDNMKCGGCVANVKKAIEALDGVETVVVDLDSKSAEVTGSVSSDVVAETVTKAGYPAKPKG